MSGVRMETGRVRGDRCPACAVSEGIWRVSYPEATICLCPACRLQWSVEAGPRSAETVEDNHYMSPRSYGDPARYRPFTAFFRLAHTLIPAERPLRILDVGCGSGVFLREAVRRGHEVWGIEADRKLRDRLPTSVLDRVRFALVEDVHDLPEHISAITFWDSFEHLDDPVAVCRRLKPSLTPAGFFFARTNHNFDVYNLVAQALVIACPPLGRPVLHACFHRPIHVWNFSRAGLRLLLEQAEYRIVYEALDDTPAFRLSPNRFVQALFRLAYAVNRAIGGGKIMTVAFRPARTNA